MQTKRNEISFYREIQNFIEVQLISNFASSKNSDISIYWGIGELKTQLQCIVNSNMLHCSSVQNFVNRIPQLNLDIFALITDRRKYEILILEIKMMQSVGLKEWSQLIGYCLVSGAKYGLLVNIDNGASQRLSSLLRSEKNLHDIVEIYNGQSREHKLGFMQWDSIARCFDYSNLGTINSLSLLSKQIMYDFS